jgi:hypothetical protein
MSMSAPPRRSAAEDDLRKECARLQTANAALQSDMVMKHVPLEDLHAVRAQKFSADAALARLADCVHGWAQRRGDAVPGQQLQTPTGPEQVSALFEYIKSGSRRHLAAACTPRQSQRACVGGASALEVGSPWPSPAASPVVDGEHVAGLRSQLVELEGRLKTQSSAHEQQLASAAAAQQAIRDELSAKQKELAQHAGAAAQEAAAQLQRLELAKAGAERRADEMAAKYGDAVASVEALQTQLRAHEAKNTELQDAASAAASSSEALRAQLGVAETKSEKLSQQLQQMQEEHRRSVQQQSELSEQREIMQRALESAQTQAEHGQQTAQRLQEQLQQREKTDAQLKLRVDASERDRAALKSRIETTASQIAGLESKVAQLANQAPAPEPVSQPAAEDDSQTTQAVDDDSQRTEGSPPQVQLLTASPPAPLKPESTDIEHTRKRAAPDGGSELDKQEDRQSSRMRGPAGAVLPSPETLDHHVPETLTVDQTAAPVQQQPISEPQQTTSAGQPSDASPVEPKPRESRKSRSSRDQSASVVSGRKVVMLSGFTSKESLSTLEKQLEEMGVKIKRGNAFDKSITHVVAPVGQNTWKTIAGSLAMRWVVHEGWVRDSFAAFKQQQTTAAAGPPMDRGQKVDDSFFKNEIHYGSKVGAHDIL